MCIRLSKALFWPIVAAAIPVFGQTVHYGNAQIENSLVSGTNTTIASGAGNVVALGGNMYIENGNSFTWNGTDDFYGDNGAGTFSINPAGGIHGFYVGDTSVGSLVSPGVDYINNLRGNVLLNGGTGIVVNTSAESNSIIIGMSNIWVTSINGCTGNVQIIGVDGIDISTDTTNGYITIDNTFEPGAAGVLSLGARNMWFPNNGYYDNYNDMGVSQSALSGHITFGTFSTANKYGDMVTCLGMRDADDPDATWVRLCVVDGEPMYDSESGYLPVEFFSVSSGNPRALSVSNQGSSWKAKFVLTPMTPFRVVTNTTATSMNSDYLIWMDSDAAGAQQTLTLSNGPSPDTQTIVVRRLGDESYPRTKIVFGSQTNFLQGETNCAVFDWSPDRSTWYKRGSP